MSTKPAIESSHLSGPTRSTGSDTDPSDRSGSEGVRSAAESPNLDAQGTREIVEVTHVTSQPKAIEAELLSEHTRVGRYEILGTIAQGGMGVVYRAHDPELARSVALKLLKTEAGGSQVAADLRRRALQREAQALARVAHPNVIAVHDVGIWNGQVFVAMELVEGGTLRAWLRDAVRTQREILQVFIEAGQGLAAAHRAGLIHRDFKPSNVLIGPDARPRVLDFGLARAPETGASERPDDLESESTRRSSTVSDLLDSPLTVVGAIVGTPAYMAPEQQRGETVDARTDQFSYCVTLYEALFGDRPYPARVFRHHKSPPKPEFTGAKIRVSSRVRRVIARGLAIDPAQRFPSMDALLAELRKEMGQGRRLMAFSATAMATAAVVAVPTLQQEDPAAVCARSRTTIDVAWNASLKDALRRSFLATNVPHAGDTFRRVTTVLDGYATRWADMRQQACEATRVHGVQSDELLDRRALCLDRARGELAALARALGTQTTASVIDKAVGAAHGLPDLAACADSDTLLAGYPPPPLEQRDGVERISARLDEASAERRAGRTQSAMRIAGETLAEAEALDYPPVNARAQELVGSLAAELGEYDKARRHLSKAADIAAIARNDALTAQAWIHQLELVAIKQGHPEQAPLLDSVAEQWVARAGTPVRVKTNLLETRGHIAFARGDLTEAEATYRAQADMIRQHFGATDPSLAIAYNSIGAAVASQGNYADASVVFQQALDLGSETLGPGHPWLALVTTNLGLLHQRLGNLDRARALHERALSTYESIYGENHPRVAHVLGSLGAVHVSLGDFVAAEQVNRRAIEIVEAAEGPEHPNLGTRLQNLAQTLLRQSRWDEAKETCTRAVSILEKQESGHLMTLAASLDTLAEIEHWQGRLAEAERFYRRALEVADKSEVKNPGTLVYVNLGLASVRHDLGDFAEAEARIERARHIATEELGSHPQSMATIHRVLGVLRRSQGQLEEAVFLHEEALKASQTEEAQNPSSTAVAQSELATTLLATGDGVRALSLFTKALEVLKEHDPAYVEALLGLGRAQAITGDVKAAVVTLEQVHERVERSRLSPAHGAQTSFALAKALWNAGSTGRALDLARRAENLARISRSPNPTPAEIRTWLANPS